jgi:hypothetical protein
MRWLTRLLYGDEHEAWRKACTQDILKSYVRFRTRFPTSVHVQDAGRRIEELDWLEVRERDEMIGYEFFMTRATDSALIKEARTRLKVIAAERQAIKDAARNMLPRGIRGDISAPDSAAGVALYISVHILGLDPDSDSPFFDRARATRHSMYEQAKQRLTQVYRALFPAVGSLPIDEVIVEIRHGIRHVGIQGSHTSPDAAIPSKLGVKVIWDPQGGDSSTSIYSVSLSIEKAKELDWSSISDHAIQKAWKVLADRIATLEFRRG